jgi:hypothetical protein
VLGEVSWALLLRLLPHQAPLGFRRLPMQPVAVQVGSGALLLLRFCSRASRKPRLSLRLSGEFPFRFAARTFLALLFHDPPRFTRSVPI